MACDILEGNSFHPSDGLHRSSHTEHWHIVISNFGGLQAPGYSAKISRPMDFKKVRGQLENGLYRSWDQLMVIIFALLIALIQAKPIMLFATHSIAEFVAITSDRERHPEASSMHLKHHTHLSFSAPYAPTDAVLLWSSCARFLMAFRFKRIPTSDDIIIIIIIAPFLLHAA